MEVDDEAEVVEEIHALHELAFVVVADELDTYAAVDVVLHNLYKLKSKRDSKIDFDYIIVRPARRQKRVHLYPVQMKKCLEPLVSQ